MKTKFRAWDKRNKMMRNVAALLFSKDTSIQGVKYWKNATELKNLNAKNIILMQATGLQDQKGVDIYEGDIIRLVGAFEDFDTGIVEFWKGAFVVNYENVNADFSYFDDISLPIEVIGNIYENPNLLEENQ